MLLKSIQYSFEGTDVTPDFVCTEFRLSVKTNSNSAIGAAGEKKTKNKA